MKKMNGKSLNIEKENISKLKFFFSEHKDEFLQVFPEVGTEGKIDVEKLQLILGENVEDEEERYSFNWNGKRDAIRISQTPTTGTLRPDVKNSKSGGGTSNIYIEGDNLEVLKILQKSYHRKIKMIYIDPPYNTGKDFVYRDNYRDNIKNYLEFTEQIDEEGNKLSTNTDTSGRYHTDWLKMMYPRLRLARNLLSDDGVIFISIDDNEVHNLRKICDEIFGEDNFVAMPVRRRDSQANLSKNLSTIHEYVFIYSNTNNAKLNKISGTIDSSLYSNPDNDPRGPYVTMPCTNRGGSTYEIKTPTGKVIKDEWRFKKETYKSLYNDNRIYFPKGGEGKPRYKIYLKEKIKEGILANSWWEDLSSNQTATIEFNNLMGDKNIFDNPKPVDFINRLLELSTHNDSIVLDFFAGSSTTAHAVMNLNAEDGGKRKYIMVQLPEPTDKKSEAYKAGYETISDIGRERIRRAGEKILEDNKGKEGIKDLDIGFKSFKLDTSNIKEWNPDYTKDEFEDFDVYDYVNNFVPNRTSKDILYEIILKYGIDLSTPIEEYTINKKTIYSIAFGSLYICLDDNIDEDVVQEILKLNREYKMPNPVVVFKDLGFKNDEIKLNAKLTLNDNGIEEVVSI